MQKPASQSTGYFEELSKYVIFATFPVKYPRAEQQYFYYSGDAVHCRRFQRIFQSLKKSCFQGIT